nr:MAG: internal scaffolding protein [Microviridae sp.]
MSTYQHPFLRAGLDDPKPFSDATAHDEFGPSLTDQSFVDEASIDQILAKYARTGILAERVDQPMFTDLVGVTNDYQTALNLVLEADEAFFALPARIRSRFKNDPGQLLSFLEDPKNLKEAFELGLIQTDPNPPAPPAPSSSPAVQPAPAEPAKVGG